MTCRRRCRNPRRAVPARLAARTRELRPFLAMEVLERALALEAGGAKVLHLELGEPDGPAPPAAVEAGARRPRRRCHPLHRQPRAAGPARGDRGGHREAQRGRDRSRPRARHERHLARDAAGLLPAGRARRRSAARRAPLPLLPELHPPLGRDPGARPLRSRGRLAPPRRARARRADAPHARPGGRLAREPDGCRAGPREPRGARLPRAARRLRRDLRRPRLRRRARARPSRPARPTSSCSTASRSATR